MKSRLALVCAIMLAGATLAACTPQEAAADALQAANALKVRAGRVVRQFTPHETVPADVAIKADVDQLVRDFNAHDAVKVAGHDLYDVVQMSHGGPNIVGAAADLASNRQQFATDPSARIAVADPRVDVAPSGEMAVYRSTYLFTSTGEKTGKPIHEAGNYLAGYRLQEDGTWRMAWSVVSDTPAAPPAAGPASPTGGDQPAQASR